MQFTKLFNSILDSTIWQEPPPTKLVWITMLAMVDRKGEVHTSIPGLAKRAGVEIGECEAALECLMSPDKYSRTKDHEGRRISEIDGGFELLNHGKYRALLSAEERREYNRKKQAEYREKKRKSQKVSKSVNDMSITVNHSEQNAHITEAEAEAEAEENTPLTPQGGNWGEVFPKGSLQTSPTQQKRIKVKSNNDRMIYVGRWFGRKASTLWTVSEAKALMEINPTKDEIKDMSAYRSTPNPYHRRDIMTLLNNWNTELDRAREGAGNKPRMTHRTKDDPEGWEEAHKRLFPEIETPTAWGFVMSHRKDSILAEIKNEKK